MADHLLHVVEIESEGYVHFRLTCEHDAADQRWWCTEPTGEFVFPEGSDGCWFESWWSALGNEMIGNIPGPVTFPLAVKPSEVWHYDDGGQVVRDPSDSQHDGGES